MEEKVEKIRHGAAHLLAQAVKQLYPEVKFGIGPVIENGFYYDFLRKEAFTPEDLKNISKRMKELVRKGIAIEKKDLKEDDLEDYLKNEPLKKELYEELLNEGEKATFYQQGEFVDLCRGPHVPNTKELKNFALTKVSGAYWKGDSKNLQLQRIYGVAFETEEELKEYLHRMEEAEKRDHRKLGRELNLVSFHDEAPGMPFFLPKGMIIWEELINYWKLMHNKAGYKQIRTPIILNKALWLKSGHWDHYKENMYFTKIDNEDYAIKPMNCPGCMLVFKEELHSYRELPLKIAEIGLVHRHELSGVLSGLFRVRSFYQDDAHIFCTEEQMEEEIINLIYFFDEVYSTFGLKFNLELSTKPEKALGSEELWNKAENILEAALKKKKKEYKINPGDGAFYGPKIDFHIKDAIGRTWQCGTIQLDFQMPEKFDLTYEGADGTKHRPVMLHRVIYGGVERFFGILIEHYAGKFPLWLSPIQVKIVTVNDGNIEYAEKVLRLLKEKGIRAELDKRAESIGKKVRTAILERVNYIMTIGDQEVSEDILAIRDREGKLDKQKLDYFINNLVEEIRKKC